MTDAHSADPALLVDNNMNAFLDLIHGIEGIEVHRDDCLRYSMSITMPYTMFNMVLKANLEPPDLETKIQQVIGRFEDHNLPLVWQVGPGSSPANLGKYLSEAGLYADGGSPGMVIDLDTLEEAPLLKPELQIRRVEDEATFQAWLHVLCADLPDMKVYVANMYRPITLPHSPHILSYVAYWEGKPVAVSTVNCLAGVAGLYNVATLPAARGMGIGTLMSTIPLLEARDLGYRMGVLISSAMGKSIYERIGFHQVCEFQQFVLDNSSAV